jgi:hypothetical protein
MSGYEFCYLNFTSGHGGDGRVWADFDDAWKQRNAVIKSSRQNDKDYPVDKTVAITIDPYEEAQDFAIIYALPEYKNYVDRVWFDNDQNYDIFIKTLNKYYKTNKPQRGKYV